MSTQHLSDEAVAAFADGVLSGHARERAGRHTAACSECARAVRVQREAVLALRAAPAPDLPSGLLDRLRSVPATTPIRAFSTAVAPDGSAVFAAFGTVPGASLGAPEPPAEHGRRRGPIALTAAVVAAAGVLAVASSSSASPLHSPSPPVTGHTRAVPVAAVTTPSDGGTAVVQPYSLVSYRP